MQIASGTTCTRGLKLGPVNITDVKLIAPPPSGQVAIKGPSYLKGGEVPSSESVDYIAKVGGHIEQMATGKMQPRRPRSLPRKKTSATKKNR
jgi:hypothetical protein